MQGKLKMPGSSPGDAKSIGEFERYNHRLYNDLITFYGRELAHEIIEVGLEDPIIQVEDHTLNLFKDKYDEYDLLVGIADRLGYTINKFVASQMLVDDPIYDIIQVLHAKEYDLDEFERLHRDLAYGETIAWALCEFDQIPENKLKFYWKIKPVGMDIYVKDPIDGTTIDLRNKLIRHMYYKHAILDFKFKNFPAKDLDREILKAYYSGEIVKTRYINADIKVNLTNGYTCSPIKNSKHLGLHAYKMGNCVEINVDDYLNDVYGEPVTYLFEIKDSNGVVHATMACDYDNGTIKCREYKTNVKLKRKLKDIDDILVKDVLCILNKHIHTNIVKQMFLID